jgi:hypothetical protein
MRSATAVFTAPIALSTVLVLSACQTPAPADSNSALVWGVVRLVPRDGVTPVRADDSAYADRDLRDVEFVDYERPGFVVVHTNGPAPDDIAAISIRDAGRQIRISPEESVAGRAGTISIRNETLQSLVVSDPAQGVMRSLGPDEEFLIRNPSEGLHSLYVVGHSELRADVFIAPGPFALASSRGRYELRNLEPGSRELRVWHPRFPPVSHQLWLEAGESLHRDLRLGVDVGRKVELDVE